MNEIIIVDLPKAHDEIKGCWYNGYPVHKGHTENSLNYATLYSNQNQIRPDQKKLEEEFNNFKKTLKQAGLRVHTLPFPEEINQIDSLHHDAVFARDAGMMFKDYWIKSHFSAQIRQPEADAHAKIITKKFKKQVVELPKNSFLEFGDVIFLQTKNGSYYFGGLSRSTESGHNFARTIIQPDHFYLIESDGYHLDTVFSPVLNANNELTAFLAATKIIEDESLACLKKFGVQIIDIDSADSCGEGEELGNYAVNTLIAPGLMLNCARFLTKGVEDKLKKIGIKRFVSSLTHFGFAGGSYHCLTNEIYR